ncbi:2-oxoglutarate dehydrogenase E1 component [Niastella yeongjuensis]|uniref:oxoglutarate dehydrogenase (succinyl-transferring) n=1 Tax=Niastella yeongjuensis TaxID=354355 RepID=A0A1V9E3Q5_9BACT|nr:2-oxoglutarate dehydrogenase E1 component [Niastella yeongjuensis]OQP40726.1 2-oxoglutarate dehydrogenase E1 component [Niastella yeongjuensis]SEP03516.1 2-oxoglutarate dehydrogenase E1 component [Niastella yeongjuensis]
MDQFTYLNNGNAAYVSALYDDYQKDPASVDFVWQKFFEGFDLGKSSINENNPAPPSHTVEVATVLEKEINVLNLINGYRTRGHLFTKTNPVMERRKHSPALELENFGLIDADLDTIFNAGAKVGIGPATLREIRELLEQTYCRSIGAEYLYMRDPEKIKWFESRMEKERNTPRFSADKKKNILNRLNEAVVFENFLGTKFLGQKRFSLEGAESLIPALDFVIEKGAELGVEEYIIGMGHRGRLNVLANIMRKPYKEIFSEFQGKNYDVTGVFGGDVKYHLGYSNDIQVSNGRMVHISLCPNPSHLETVDAIVEGETRSKADLKYNGNHRKIAPILLHGDASIAGQGIVYEILQMSKLDGFRTGGTIHLVVNNQVGFTTNYKDGRSSTYCTDLAKVVLSPVFHVNGDDAEALAYVINMAMEYRQTFQEDVFIDILCYRKYGHNESDEPKFTQPLLYKAIEAHPNPKEIYVKKLIAEGSVDANYVEELEKTFKDQLQILLDESKAEEKFKPVKQMFDGVWKGLRIPVDKDFHTSPDTSISAEALLNIGRDITTLPTGKKFLKKVEKLFEARKKMAAQTQIFDWAMGELLAYGSLLKEHYAVRLTGEDVERGTFSHRHAILTVEDSEEKYNPLDALQTDVRFEIYNSLLSEYAVLGFEYGYALANPNALIIWEAQFGDFANGAQIIIDQYIASAETKWKLGNGLVLLLPHGYEGQGPEHSSARIERFMELCANNNIQVANCSTPANFFHILRRQLHRDFRKPLIIFTPKSLLRHPKCVSPIDDFTRGGFQELIDDSLANTEYVKRILFCSGKIYYDLLEKQRAEERRDIAIVRIEQLYPTPVQQMKNIKKKYSNARELIWVQEEPQNMGAWPYICRKFCETDLQMSVISRRESSSTATGHTKLHEPEQAAIIEDAFKTSIHIMETIGLK